MTRSIFDPDHDHISSPTLDILADPCRRRLLSAAVLTAIGCALLAVGIPFPAQAAGSSVADVIDFTRDTGAPTAYPHASQRSAPLVFNRPDGKPLCRLTFGEHNGQKWP